MLNRNYENEAFEHLVKTEKRYHLFKALLIFVSTIATIAFIFYEINFAVNRINQHIDCIVKLFATPNREGKHITNIDQCRISN